MANGLLTQGVVQLHPTLACNLRCAHCYSSSGPGAGHGIPVATLLRALAPLQREGYEVVSISGGEPFAYRRLDQLVRGAAESGWKVHLITNGTLVDARRLAPVAPYLSAVAVSLDGGEARHNQVRGTRRAFAQALAGMDALAAAGLRFGVAMAVSDHSLDDVPDVYDTCLAHGASLLSLRPLAALGRAVDLDGAVLSDSGMARLFLAAQLLDSVDPDVRVRTDVTPTAWIVDRHAGFDIPRGPNDRSLADMINPLIVDERGLLLPLAHGVDPGLALGHVGDVPSALAAARASGLAPQADAVDRTFAGLDPERARYVDWYAEFAAVAQATAAVAQATGQPVALRSG